MIQRKIGFIGRFQPFHTGHAHLLAALCKEANQVRVGIGSPYRCNQHNPFKVELREAMINSYLEAQNYKLVRVRDYSHLPGYDESAWINEVIKSLRNIDIIVTGNNHVQELLKDVYTVVSPAEIIGEERFKGISGTRIRERLRRSKPVDHLVPPSTLRLLDQHRSNADKGKYSTQNLNLHRVCRINRVRYVPADQSSPEAPDRDEMRGF